jgi:hypothetical protein
MKHKARVSSLVRQGLLFLAHLVVSGPGCFPRLALALAFFLDLSHVEAIAGDRGRVERKRRSKSGKNDQRYVMYECSFIWAAVDEFENRSIRRLTSSSNSGNAETRSTTKALSASASRLAATRTRLINYRRS